MLQYDPTTGLYTDPDSGKSYEYNGPGSDAAPEVPTWKSDTGREYTLPEFAHPAPATPPPGPKTTPLEDHVTLGDYGDIILQGGASVAQSVGWLARTVGMDKIGSSIEDMGKNAVDYWDRRLSAPAKESLSKQFVKRNEQTGEYEWGDADLNTLGLYGAQSLLPTVAGMGAGAGLSAVLKTFANPFGVKVLERAVEIGTRPGAKPVAQRMAAEAAKKLKLVHQVTGAIGFGAGEGAVSAPQVAMQVEDQVNAMSHDDLMAKSLRYRQVYDSVHPGEMTEEQRQAYARNTVAKEAGSMAGFESGITTSLLGAPMGAFFGGVLGRTALKGLAEPTTRAMSALTGAAGEAGQEFAQSGVEQFEQNKAIRDLVDKDQDLFKGVLEQAVGGALAGGVMGLAFGAGEGPHEAQGGAKVKGEAAGAKPKLKADVLYQAALRAEEAGAPRSAIIDAVTQAKQQGNVLAGLRALRDLETAAKTPPEEEGPEADVKPDTTALAGGETITPPGTESNGSIGSTPQQTPEKQVSDVTKAVNPAIPAETPPQPGPKEAAPAVFEPATPVQPPKSVEVPRETPAKTVEARKMVAQGQPSESPGHLAPEAFIPARAVRALERAPYVDDQGSIVQSSRLSPNNELDKLPLGVWKIDEEATDEGHAIEQLREVPIDQLQPTEAIGPNDVKAQDVERYAGFKGQGPPISVVESAEGTLKVVDGHRRLAAAQRRGETTVRAWVSPYAGHGNGLTYELAKSAGQVAAASAPEKIEAPISSEKSPAPASEVMTEQRRAHLVSWLKTQFNGEGERFEKYNLIYDFAHEHPDLLDRMTWREVLDLAERQQADRGAAAPKPTQAFPEDAAAKARDLLKKKLGAGKVEEPPTVPASNIPASNIPAKKAGKAKAPKPPEAEVPDTELITKTIRASRPFKRVKGNPSKHHLLEFLAREGGIDPDSMNESENYKGIGWVGAPLLRRPGSGMSMDEAAERAAEAGYPVVDEKGNYDPHILEDKMMQQVRSKEPIFSNQSSEFYRHMMDKERAHFEGQAADRAAAAEEGFDSGAAGDAFAENPDLAPASAAEAVHSAANADLIAQANDLDEAAVERAAMQFGDDDEGFMAAVRGIIEGRGTPSENRNEVPEAAPARKELQQAQAPAEGAGRPPLELEAQRAPVQAPVKAPTPPADLFGPAPSASAQAVERERQARQQRERGAPDMQTGAGALFSNENKQVDVEDVTKKPMSPAVVERGVEQFEAGGRRKLPYKLGPVLDFLETRPDLDARMNDLIGVAERLKLPAINSDIDNLLKKMGEGDVANIEHDITVAETHAANLDALSDPEERAAAQAKEAAADANTRAWQDANPGLMKRLDRVMQMIDGHMRVNVDKANALVEQFDAFTARIENGEQPSVADLETLERAAGIFQKPAAAAPAPAPRVQVSANTVFTEDAAEKARKVLLGKLGNLNAGLDPEVMQAGITLAGYHIEKGARTFAAYAKAMLADLGEAVRPYLKSWYMAVKYDPRGATFSGEMTSAADVENASIVGIEETPDAASSGANLEPDRPNGDQLPVGGQVLQPGSGRADQTPPRSGGAPRGAGIRAGGGASVPAGGAAGGGEAGNLEVRGAGPERPGLFAGSDFGAGSLEDRQPGISVVPEPGRAGRATAVSPLNLEAKKAAQRRADQIPVKFNDPANIRETLPFLTEGQREDVVFTEARHAKPNGYGVMFTNGTGTGKTFTGLGAVKRAYRSGKRNILILAPTQIVINDWVRSGAMIDIPITQLEGLKDAGRDVVITTYANAGANNALATRTWDMILTDEAHYLGSAKGGGITDAGQTLRAIALHPQGVWKRFEMLNQDIVQEMDRLNEARKMFPAELLNRRQAALDKERTHIESNQGEKRPRVVFLSATPFAYEKSIEYAEGFLFDYPVDENKGGYNKPEGRTQFFVQHFGYRMRYNKLTEPGPEVDRDLLQRNFNTWLKQQAVLSGRMLDVDADYERKFLLAEEQIGTKIDEGLQWLSEQDDGRYRHLLERMEGNFSYHSRMYLLEALKARHAVKVVRAHLKAGRKVVVYHDFIKGGGFHPFKFSSSDNESVLHFTEKEGKHTSEELKIADLIAKFEELRPDLAALDFSGLASPIQTLSRAFPDALIINGTLSKTKREQAKTIFNDDATGPQLIIVQSDAGREGISLHDTTGKHRRTLINLGMPVRPTAAIQIEGRIYRTGLVTDGLMLYFNTGTNFERHTFAVKISERASTAENLAMGEDARGLKQAFIDAFENAGEDYQPSEADGRGGKAKDRAMRAPMTEFERAKTYYYAQQKKTSRNKAQEGIDYFATPEPLAYKMVEWAGIRSGDHVLEPSGGHGAIARFFPRNTTRTVVEPSMELATRAALVSDARMIIDRFENLHVGANKQDVIVMNPPFGKGGKTAMEHLDKAVKHLKDGGRVVALIPSGPMADARFDKWYEELDEGTYLTADVKLPSVTFERAGTSVAARIVILDKTPTNIAQASRDYSDAQNIKDFFDRIEHATVPERLAPVQPAGPAPWQPQTPTGAASLVGKRVTRQPPKFFDGTPAPNWPDANTVRSITEVYNNAGITYAKADGLSYPIGEWYDVDTREPLALPAAGTRAAAAPKQVLEAAQFNHTKTGDPVFIAKPTEYLGSERFSALRDQAKARGGWYNSYGGSGSIKGFAFKTAAARDDFIKSQAPAAPEAPAAGGGAVFSRNPTLQSTPAARGPMPATPLTPEQIGTHLSQAISELAPMIDVVIENAPEGAPADAEGHWDQGTSTIHLYADRMRSLDRAAEVLTHEAFGHLAMENLPEYADLLQGVHEEALRGVGPIADLAAELRITYENPDATTLAKETIAAYVERGGKHPIVNRFIAATRAVLRRFGIKLRFSENDLRALIAKAAHRLKEDAELVQRFADAHPQDQTALEEPVTTDADIVDDALRRLTADDPLYSRAPPVDSDAFRNWFGDSKVVDPEGKPLVVFHGTSLPAGLEPFDTFKYGDIGFHFGTVEQAEERALGSNTVMDLQEGGATPDEPSAVIAMMSMADDIRRAYMHAQVYPVYLRIERPIRATKDTSFGRPDAVYEALPGEWATQFYNDMMGDPVLKPYFNEAFMGMPSHIKQRIIEWFTTRGFDGIVYPNAFEGVPVEKKGQPGASSGESYIVFKPTQVKSAIGNVGFLAADPERATGGWSPYNESILYSRSKRVLGTPEQERALGATMATPLEDVSVADRFREQVMRLRNVNKAEIVQGLIDDAYRLKEIEEDTFGGLLDAAESAYKSVTATRDIHSILASVMKLGAPVLKEGTLQAVAGRKGFIEIFSPLVGKQGNLLHLFEGYAAAKRAYRLQTEGRERNFRPDQIEELLKLGKQYPIFDQVLKDWATFNHDMLDLAESAGAINPETRKFWENEDYIPFIREIHEEVEHAKGGGHRGVEKAKARIRTLHGSEAKIGHVLENMVQNTAHLLDVTMRNDAMGRIVGLANGTYMEELHLKPEAVMVDMPQLARALQKAGIILAENDAGALRELRSLPAPQRDMWAKVFHMVPPLGPNVVTWYDRGKARYYRVDDPLLLRTIQSMRPPQFSALMKLLSGPKRLLTWGVTKDPAFMVRNLIRDTVATWAQSGGKMLPVVEALKGAKAALNEDHDMMQIMMAGRGGGGQYDSNPRDIRKLLQRKLGTAAFGGFWDSIVRPSNWLRAYERLGSASEQANRIATYRRVLKETGSVAEAAYQAQDVLNFSMRGDWASMQFLIQTVPFLNARVQGLYRLYRGGKMNPWSFAAKGAALAAATLALMARNYDRKEYDELPDWDKDSYWHLFFNEHGKPVGPGDHWRIPKPFEVGIMFGTVWERLARLSRGDDNLELFMRRMMSAATDTLAFNPVPQAAMPIVEQFANRDAFTGAPIVGESEQGLLPEAQYTARTSPFMRKVGGAMGRLRVGDEALLPAFMRSPERLEHLLTAYFGTLGIYALGVADAATRGVSSDLPSAPTGSVYDLPVVRSFVRNPNPPYTRYNDLLYQMLDEASDTYRTMRKKVAEGDVGGARQLLRENAPKLQARMTLVHAQQEIEKINKAINLVVQSRASPEEKRQRMDELVAIKNAVFRSVAGLERIF